MTWAAALVTQLSTREDLFMQTKHPPANLLLLLACLLAGCSRSTVIDRVALKRVSPAKAAATQVDMGYPLYESQIRQMIDSGSGAAARKHGWAILSSLVSRDGTQHDGNSGYEADWEHSSWENKCTLGLGGQSMACGTIHYPLAGKPCQLPKPPEHKMDLPLDLPLLETPVQQIDLRLRSGVPGVMSHVVPAQARPSAFVSTVRYNPQAASFIREKCLYSRAGISGLHEADQLDREAVIVKLIWAIPQQNVLGVWVPDMAHKPDPGSPLYWPRVKVGLSDPSKCDSHTGYKPYQGVSPPPTGSVVPVVPLNCFYHRRYPCSLLTGRFDPSTVGQPSHCAPGQQFFYALLMGVHIITAEQRNWVWSTFWWTPNPVADPGHDGQPPDIGNRGPWWFYAMNIALDVNKPLDPKLDPVNHRLHIAFNPYLEGPHANSTSSNCMYCHRLAVMRDKGSPITADQEVAAGLPKPCAYDRRPCATGLMRVDASYYQGATPTHFLWSVAESVDLKASGGIHLAQSSPPHR